MIVTAMTCLDARRGASNCHYYPTFGFCQDTLRGLLRWKRGAADRI